MKPVCDYVVLILNYNTIEDAIAAADSVIKNAESDEYRICIADNASSNEKDRVTLGQISKKNTITFQLDKNYGYAKGNMKALEQIRERFTPRYLVIMNPDILIKQKGTIEKMIAAVEAAPNYVIGAQPLVNNVMSGVPAEMQINIRRVPMDVSDVLIYASAVQRKLHPKRLAYMNYVSERPYKDKLYYEVPSGAFFLIKDEEFKKAGDFDVRTFMYCEEPILGYKLKEQGKQFVFVPSLCVDHFHGKSTGTYGQNFKVSDFTRTCLRDSWKLYLTEYLKVSRWKANLALWYMDKEIQFKNAYIAFKNHKRENVTYEANQN